MLGHQRRGRRGVTGKEGEGQAKEHEQRTHGHGQWGGIDCGSEGGGVGASNEEKGGTTVTEQQ